MGPMFSVTVTLLRNAKGYCGTQRAILLPQVSHPNCEIGFIHVSTYNYKYTLGTHNVDFLGVTHPEVTLVVPDKLTPQELRRTGDVKNSFVIGIATLIFCSIVNYNA